MSSQLSIFQRLDLWSSDVSFDQDNNTNSFSANFWLPSLQTFKENSANQNRYSVLSSFFFYPELTVGDKIGYFYSAVVFPFLMPALIARVVHREDKVISTREQSHTSAIKPAKEVSSSDWTYHIVWIVLAKLACLRCMDGGTVWKCQVCKHMICQIRIYKSQYCFCASNTNPNLLRRAFCGWQDKYEFK